MVKNERLNGERRRRCGDNIATEPPDAHAHYVREAAWGGKDAVERGKDLPVVRDQCSSKKMKAGGVFARNAGNTVRRKVELQRDAHGDSGLVCGVELEVALADEGVRQRGEPA